MKETFRAFRIHAEGKDVEARLNAALEETGHVLRLRAWAGGYRMATASIRPSSLISDTSGDMPW